ncbi:recombinase family protein [Kocuria sp. SM24M-10]|uniref:recombinase family protein n=1 Tax=Kocuria sp. SM24M-10 TaxID=1660349 RepID=UPI00064A4A7B|nr:recombinase family protein [Kocuria sp. SM24M-10]KLU08086.1 hypothetical protein ABL57_19835 [Kocuria sp. SM24M-10]
MEQTRPRAALYVRISNDKAGAGLGVQRQESDCRSLAARLGWAVAEVIDDNDLSAYDRRKGRPGYRRLLAGLRSGEFTAVLAWHADRLHRRTAELEEFLDLIESTGAKVATVQGGDLDLSSPDGRMTAKLLATIAQREIEHGRERMVRAKAQAAASGQWRGGRRPYGYEPDGVTVREEEAAVVRYAAEQVLAGRSMRALTAEVNAQGARTTTGKPFSSTTLRTVLLRPRNAALIDHKGEILGAASWPPLLDEDTWRAVVGILTDPARVTTSGDGSPNLLTGVATCGTCGLPVQAGKSRDLTVYRCPTDQRHVARSRDLTDELVRAVIVELLRRPEALRRALAPAEGVDLEGTRAEVAALTARLDQLGLDYADGLLNAAQVKTATQRLQGRLDEARDRLAAAAASTGFEDLAAAPDPGALFLAAPVDRQRSIVRALAEVVILPSPRGRPAGWTPGQPYFRPETIKITPRT